MRGFNDATNTSVRVINQTMRRARMFDMPRECLLDSGHAATTYPHTTTDALQPADWPGAGGAGGGVYPCDYGG
jgi:hypothetical protein